MRCPVNEVVSKFIQNIQLKGIKTSVKRVQRGCLPFITAVYTFQVSHVFRLNGLDNLDEFPQLDGQLVGTNCTFFRGVGV